MKKRQTSWLITLLLLVLFVGNFAQLQIAALQPEDFNRMQSEIITAIYLVGYCLSLCIERHNHAD